ncbi:MAG: electron transfer flavoprotein subunit beta [Bdellovibrionales bacterium GWC1_52_8]|nr:MAG: electron transfer flavoprotein subunit beta [Bdellovibrionales bacterium GWB1_52_6]OFZ04474.1 MAG: electron transfer flavoprotein subunit beta [Bdellovibrionales bacterium GWA1_52_35]OFZ40697.1 MAG: electron transfer flavoprotein subunit beta [Bdellovibrionales bacterium GWC1_52_8]HCM40780.1 electron transfer flavoprotein subunit beta [Bdellovibrionales bacterium]
MNIYVCIKQVPDTETKIKLNSDSTGIDPAGIKWVMSPFDEIAVEESLRVKEKNAGSTLTVISAGPARATESIRTALAMGADNGIHIELPENVDNNTIAKALAGALKKEAHFDLIFTGKEAIDDGSAQVSQILGEFLDIPSITVAVAIEYGAGTVKCKREIEGGSFEIIEAALPVIIAGQKGLNDPRYASLPNIMKAKKKEIKALKAADVGVSDADQKIRFKNYQLPPPKQAGKKLTGDPAAQAKELVRMLHEEAKVI